MDFIFLSDIVVPPGEFKKYLLWSIAVLIAVISSLVTVYLKTQGDLKKNYEAQLKEKNDQIAKEKQNTEAERAEKIKILYEIKPALEAIAKIGEETLEFIRS